MELKITSLRGRDLSNTIGSIHTHGVNAATLTFENAKSIGANILDTPKKVAAFKRYLKDIGFSESVTSHTELEGLLVQSVMHELLDMGCTLENLHECEESGRVFEGNDGEIYFYAGY